MNAVDFLLEKAHENIEAAELLFDQEYFDIAASRAYYAMFYLAQALLLSKGLSFSSHSAVIAAFGKNFAKTNEMDPHYHQYLILSQSARNLGDYGIGTTVVSEEVRKILNWAKDFFETAEKYLKHTSQK